MELIKTAILGMGRMGKTRYDAMERNGGFEVVGMCDPNAAAMEGYSQPKFAEWQECVDKTQPEAVMVCGVNSMLADAVCYALEKGIHVFSEKPPGRTLAETMRMSDCFDAQAVKPVLKFGFNHRYHNSVIEAKTLVDFKLLGDVVCARGVYGKSLITPTEWRNDPTVAGGGILLDQGIHMLDLLRYFLGDFNDVTGTVDQLVWRELAMEDSAFAIMHTNDGKIASLHSSAIQWKHKFDLDIICTNGYISLNGLLTSTRSYGEERITYYQKDLRQETGKMGNPVEHTLCFTEDESWDKEIGEFYDAVRLGKPVVNGTMNDAVQVMKLIDAVYARGGGNAGSEIR